MEHLPDKIYFKDLESHFICANKSKLAQHGLSSESELAGKTDFDFFAKIARAGPWRMSNAPSVPACRWSTTRKRMSGPTAARRGFRRPNAVRDSEGRIVGTFGLSRDITRRKRVEDELGLIANELRARNAMLEKTSRWRGNSRAPCCPALSFFRRRRWRGGGLVRFHHYFTPSMAVSGDFFNVCKISESEAGIFICDVMGHGVRAALVAAMMHTLLGERTPSSAIPRPCSRT